VCISSYIIGQLISQDEKERADLKYSDLLSIVEEEINELTTNKQHPEGDDIKE